MLEQLPLLLLLLLQLTAIESVKVTCDSIASNRDGWVRHDGNCYRWIEAPTYWYTAEQACIASNGHLTSIANHTENILIGRLTYCEAAWIGRYGTHADRLADPTSFRWTDGSSATGFHRHNSSLLSTPHQPLMTAQDLQWFNNLYHFKRGYVCKSAPAESSVDVDRSLCPSGWQLVGDYCYLQPGFQATYIEADFYCSGRQAHLTSVHDDAELRLLSLLDLSQPVCSLDLWIGLVKLNPCRADYFNGRLQQVCYQWSDRSGSHRDFPAWASGNPNNDLVTNCVVLRDRHLFSVPCHLRRNFVCKRPKSGGPTRPPTQPPTQPPSTPELLTDAPTQPPTQTQSTPELTPDTPTQPPTPSTWSRESETTTETPLAIVAAFDFRRAASEAGKNLVQPGRFKVLDWGDARLQAGVGAVLSGLRGIQIDTERGALTSPLKHNQQWTIFYYVKRPTAYDSLLVDVSDATGEPGLSIVENPRSGDLTLYSSVGYFRDESNPKLDANGSADKPDGLRGAIVMTNRRATFYRNGVDASSHSPATSDHRYPNNDEILMLGNQYKSALAGYHGWLACFGVAHSALTKQELELAFRRYCP